MKGNRRKTRRSVVLAADAGGYSIATISLAVQVARSIKSRLRGVFIEDEDLLLLSGLPFTREISLTTARARPLESARVERAMRAAARRFRLTLEREARDLKAGWSFATVRGRILEVGLRSRGQASCIIFAPGRYDMPVAAARVPMRILLVAGPSKHLRRALAGLLHSLGGRKMELTLVADDGGDLLADVVADFPGQIALTHAGRSSLPGLMHERGSAYDYALLAQREDSAELTQMLERLRCPVLLIA